METIKLKKSSQLNRRDLRKAIFVLRAVNHKLRQRIIDLLENSDTMTVTDIYIKLGLQQSIVSQHLRILRNSGVLKTESQGKYRYYSIDRDRLNDVQKAVEILVNLD